jgi:ketosteroid isomerase-like protein
VLKHGEQNSTAVFMKKSAAIALSLFLFCEFGNSQETAPVVSKQIFNAAECAVWNREKSFAASVENHDTASFLEHIDTNAVFIKGNGSYLRGSAEVAKAWASVIEGKDIILRWHPGFVAISSDGKSAISRGPYWIEDPDPNTTQKFMTGTYQSTWVKNKKGQWHVFLDGGTPGPAPAKVNEVEALKKTWAPTCPS